MRRLVGPMLMAMGVLHLQVRTPGATSSQSAT